LVALLGASFLPKYSSTLIISAGFSFSRVSLVRDYSYSSRIRLSSSIAFGSLVA